MIEVSKKLKHENENVKSRRHQMNKNPTTNQAERLQVAVRNVAFCTVILLVFSIGLSSVALVANNQPSVYKANVGKITIEVDPGSS